MKKLREYLKILVLESAILLAAGIGLGLALLYLPQGTDLRLIAPLTLILTGLSGGLLAGRGFYPHWLRAGAMAAAGAELLLIAALLSLAPPLLTAGALAVAFSLLLPAALCGSLLSSGLVLAAKTRRQNVHAGAAGQKGQKDLI